MQEQPTRQPWIIWGCTDYLTVERDAGSVNIVVPLVLGAMTAKEAVTKAEPLLSAAEREQFREAFGL